MSIRSSTTTLAEIAMQEDFVPFFRVDLTDSEIDQVVECLRSGWLTTGSRVAQFQERFAAAVKASYAVALNSCTAALHLAVEALGLKPGQAVLVPTLTFAATAEVIRYQGAVPLFVDCDPVTLNLDLSDAAQKIRALQQGETPFTRELKVVGILPVHVGGLMLDMAEVRQFADAYDLWVVEDAAHAFPAAFYDTATSQWRRSGQGTADITCFSFYANKTITTGEGGMAVTEELKLAERIKAMSLHGLTHDAWHRFGKQAAWDYKILDPGYKYNLTDIAASLGLGQLERAEAMREQRENIAHYYQQELADLPEIELPACPPDRIHSWHLYPIRLRLEKLLIDREEFVEQMRLRGVGTSVHWRPLHLHPYYQETFGWQEEELPQASRVWKRLISLPIFPGMQPNEMRKVVQVVHELCEQSRSVPARAASWALSSDYLRTTEKQTETFPRQSPAVRIRPK